MQSVRVVYVMGVAGSGKTTVGARLARELGWQFIEGDDFHPPANRQKMAAGVPLEDADRWGWLAAIRREVERILGIGTNAVAACSALKRPYRDVLRQGIEPESRVLYLRLTPQVAWQRVQMRPNHSFPASLVDSQFATLEDPTGEPGVLEVDGCLDIGTIVKTAQGWIRAGG